MFSSQHSCDEDPFQLISSPLTFSAINVATSAASMKYRSSTSTSSTDSGDLAMSSMNPIQSKFNHDADDGKPSISFFVPSQVRKSAMSDQEPITFLDHDESSSIQFSLNTAFPKSKCLKLNPFAIDQNPVDIFNEKSSSVEMDDVGECPLSAPPFPFCNPLNSCLMTMASHCALEVLSCILRAFVGDLDFNVDTAQCHIDGVAFVSDHAVYFVLYLHESVLEEDEGLLDTAQSTVEYRRQSGDMTASARFWNYIQRQIELRCGGTANPMEVDSECVAMDHMHFDSVHDLDYDIDTDTDTARGYKGYLDQITVSIQRNEQWMVDELRCLYQSTTMKHGHTLCADILRHGAFLKVLSRECILHQDVCVSRCALLILQQIAQHQGGCMQLATYCMPKFKVFETINKVLCCHRRPLIKKHAIRFLDRLADAPSWNIQEIDKTQLLWRIKQHEEEYPEDEEMQSMIGKINGKLSGN